jgi:hypothetical protein
MVGKAQKSHGARSELNYVFGLEKVDWWNPIRTCAIQSSSRPMRFPTMKGELRGKKFLRVENFSMLTLLEELYMNQILL